TRGPAFRNNYSQLRFVDFRLVTAVGILHFRAVLTGKEKPERSSGGKTGQPEVDDLRPEYKSRHLVGSTRSRRRWEVKRIPQAARRTIEHEQNTFGIPRRGCLSSHARGQHLVREEPNDEEDEEDEGEGEDDDEKEDDEGTRSEQAAQ